MNDLAEWRMHFWQRYTTGTGTWVAGSQGPPGAELAALRRGVGREAGSVPVMWPFYTTLSEDGRLTESLRAEHLALTLYAVHQQSQPVPVHRKGIGFGKAARTLRNSGLYSEEAVDRRFVAAATAGSLAELSVHLRGLVTQMRALRDCGFDYTRLFRDLRSWQRPERRAAVRRRWGAEYFAFAPDESRREEIEKAVAGPRSGHE